ncbi:hypothetical protein Dfri01_39050 [Dyadobacter frigoris]|uniref:hypothetical protein n=1 Tax=Dyadobacter frigoris TaxID=2576211 RepID=UPI0024A4CAA5|nr:hypothetical protein [Dyadobacter frigoris]GLU54444.1 hypothetical protein Dfri01_39050 [Dyadobacter frigoris]
MIKVTIPELGAECQLVNSYADLKNRDVIKLVRMVYLNPANMDSKVALLRELFVAPENVWFQLEQRENHDQVWRLLETLDWVWKGPQHRPAPFLRIKGKSFFLPDENLYNLNTAEFVIATAHLIGFHSAKDDGAALQSLSSFMATIVRPKPDVLQRLKTNQDNADPRESYNSIRSERRAVHFGKVDLVTKIMIAQWFNNAANRLLTQYGMTSGDPDAAPISQGLFVQDWERQVVKVAQSTVYGNYDKVMERPITDILAYIDIKNEEIRKQIEANKRK